ncbi:hypothetical protein HY639_05465 [Candidatus Woesearchaeota archaeon]|nr:hypothetical protein [Candidatus Woesearchaeota archaeon]
MDYVRIVIYCPPDAEESIKHALWDNGAGTLGKYACYSFISDGTSTWKPLAGATPTLGEPGKLSTVHEKRIETICPAALVQNVITAVRKVHPYEMPVIEVYRLENP